MAPVVVSEAPDCTRSVAVPSAVPTVQLLFRLGSAAPLARITSPAPIVAAPDTADEPESVSVPPPAVVRPAEEPASRDAICADTPVAVVSVGDEPPSVIVPPESR